MTKAFAIGERLVGDGERCFVIAEAGVNHNGQLALAHALIDAAGDAGADAVKFQTFVPELLAAPTARKVAYQFRSSDGSDSQHDMLRPLVLPRDGYAELKAHAEDRGLLFLSTPFDDDSVDFLDRLGVSAFKISSGDLTNSLLLRHVATKGRPVILSTGMATIDEAVAAVADVRQVAEIPVAVLHCVSAYPADATTVNLRAMATLRSALAVPVGFSDHTIDSWVAVGAVAAGASLLEKHLTLDPGMSGPDHAASLSPPAFRDMVGGIRRLEQALGSGDKGRRADEDEAAGQVRRSLYWRRSLRRGTVISEGDLIALRPAGGVPPTRWSAIVGRHLVRDVEANGPVSMEDAG